MTFRLASLLCLLGVSAHALTASQLSHIVDVVSPTATGTSGQTGVVLSANADVAPQVAREEELSKVLLKQTRHKNPAACQRGLREMMSGLQSAQGLSFPTNHQFDEKSSGPEVTYLAQLAQAELLRLKKAPGQGTICQSGFDFGDAAYGFLCGTNGKVFSWDVGGQSYVKPAHDLLERQFPHRHSLVIGDSTKKLTDAAMGMSPLGSQKCDVVFVRGGNTKDKIDDDITNFAKIAAPGALLIVDDCEEEASRVGLAGGTTQNRMPANAAFQAEEAAGLFHEEDNDKEAGLKQLSQSRSVCVARYGHK